MTSPTGLGATIIAVCVSLTLLAGLFLGLRLYCKIIRHRGFWWDDYILIAAWICLAIGTGLVIFNVTLGFGKDMSEVDPAVVPKIALTGTIFGLFAVLSAAWSKTSFALTLIRLVDGWMSWFLWFLIIATNITMDLVIVFSFVKCTPAKKVWHSSLPGTCWNPMVATYYNIFAGVPPPLLVRNATKCLASAARIELWIELASLYGALPSVPSPSWQHPFPSCAYWYCAFTAARLIKSPIDLYALFE
ncbi:hypothetical protein BFJ68_g9597 [Fusarium oxysporum]|uniref:Rhodopsin domain-containing protein n=1 Tax=Fusarium oxysporum TaxID=5507 RepID=A0A420QU18_FUSOX|nr:hypothetical protein BFJ68_g9597 [Fusarium oxysporum]